MGQIGREMRALTASVLLMSATSQIAPGPLPHLKLFTAAGCPTGSEATMANPNPLRDMPSLRATPTGFLAEPTATAGEADGSQLRLCGVQGFLFDTAFYGLCDASTGYSDGNICLQIPATTNLFGGGYTTYGGYYAKLSCLSECPEPAPPTTTSTTTTTSSVEPEGPVLQGGGSWVCDSYATCETHFGAAATSISGEACCGNSSVSACFVCLFEENASYRQPEQETLASPKAKKGASHHRNRRGKGGKAGKSGMGEGAIDRIPVENDDNGQGRADAGSGDSGSGAVDTPESVSQPFELSLVCADYNACTAWHGVGARCCWGAPFCGACDEFGDYNNASFGNGHPHCWNEIELVAFLALGLDAITSAKPFSETCPAAIGSVYGSGCCDSPSVCEECFADAADRIGSSDPFQPKGSSPDQSHKSGKKWSSASSKAHTGNRAMHASLIMMGALIAVVAVVSVRVSRHRSDRTYDVPELVEPAAVTDTTSLLLESTHLTPSKYHTLDNATPILA